MFGVGTGRLGKRGHLGQPGRPGPGLKTPPELRMRQIQAWAIREDERPITKPPYKRTRSRSKPSQKAKTSNAVLGQNMGLKPPLETSETDIEGRGNTHLAIK
ncbi:hypothetical protein NDU88_002068 [Pleurodeles waltl]|uniref:Uncharacterized protein n=1 Tax=Pleurodeles waltl TaxID=8319 RepID=A0AAV7T1A3_PLEWA|nr:hypothetical protein NDU88_002068 [Pleurodeles waltl]